MKWDCEVCLLEEGLLSHSCYCFSNVGVNIREEVPAPPGSQSHR